MLQIFWDIISDAFNKLFSNYVGIAFVIICLIAVGILVYERLRGNKQAGDQLGGGFVRLFLVFVVLIVTGGIKVEAATFNQPWIGIAAFILIEIFFVIRRILPHKFPAVKIRNLEFRPVILKCLFYASIPLLVLWLKGDTFQNMGLTSQNFWRDIGISLVLVAVITPLTLLPNPAVWQPIRSGKVGLRAVSIGFPVSVSYYFLSAGFPEEVFFRVLLQGQLASLLGNQLSALLIASLVFGWVHIPTLKEWHPERSIQLLWAESTLEQVIMGLFFGVLWIRTGSLLPLVLTHSLVDSITFLVDTIQKIQIS